jgi:hypothetical protein
MDRLKVINLFAGPGAGKSTTAAGLFHLMKLRGDSVELVTEYAKDCVWGDCQDTLKNQLYVFAKQYKRLQRLQDKVAWAVTDSPLLLSLIYMPAHYPDSFRQLVLDFYAQFDNHNFFISRTKEYNPVGRNETKEESLLIDLEIKDLLIREDQPFHSIAGDARAPAEILSLL